jgi:hypothetical protein
MNDKRSPANIFNLVLVLAAVAGGGLFVQRNLQGARPAVSAASAGAIEQSAPNKVLSRLWQDPFEAFGSSTNAEEPASKTQSEVKLVEVDPTNALFKLRIQTLPNEISHPARSLWNELGLETAASKADRKIAVLGVMLPGGPYLENKESRQRLRYAVEVGLLTKNLGPEDRSRISTNWVALVSNGWTNKSRFAFEWFLADTAEQDLQTCVLWLNEDDFADDPASGLHSLLAEMQPDARGKDVALPSKVSFYLVGPYSSDTLRSLVLTETSHPFFHMSIVKSDQFHILSPEAHAEVLGTNDPFKEVLSGRLTEKFGHPGVFHNWIATDEQLAKLIAAEIQNRMGSPMLRDSSNVVAILSESDTFFGRTLAHSLKRELSEVPACHNSNNVWQFGYLRGLDGSKPPKERPKEPAPAPPATPEETVETILSQQQQGEKADGDAQLDYIVRLAQFLEAQDARLRERGGRRIIAVGLAGSDVYDKLTLLRGLRPRLPEAVFFTTDLDAVLCTGDQFKYARNLLVASPYSLTPAPGGTEGLLTRFPPFRDTYQSGVYRVCQAVMNYLSEGMTNDLDASTNDLNGGLFKIGRYGPVALDEIGNWRQATLSGALGRPRFWGAVQHVVMSAPVLYGFFSALVLVFGLWLSRGFSFRRKVCLDPHFYAQDILDAVAVAKKLTEGHRKGQGSPVGFLFSRLAFSTQELLKSPDDQRLNLSAFLARGFNALMEDLRTSDLERFSGLDLRPETRLLYGKIQRLDGKREPDRQEWTLLKRLLIEDLFPQEISPCASFRDAEQKELRQRVSAWIIPAILLVGCCIGFCFQFAERVAAQKGEEPWNFWSGTSIWPCECLRLVAAVCGIALLCYNYQMHRKYRAWLWREYFGKNWIPPQLWWEHFWADCKRLRRPSRGNAPKLTFVHWNEFWERWFGQGGLAKSAAPADGPNPNRVELAAPCWINKWRAPWLAESGGAPELSIDAETLFKGYLRLNLLPLRLARGVLKFIVFTAVTGWVFFHFRSAPTLLLIRGPLSHLIDQAAQLASAVVFLLVFFFVLDASRVTRNFLDLISRCRTRWPEELLKEKSAQKGIEARYLPWWIDVDFAAVQTKEAGRLMLGPFLLLLLLFLSRFSYFDNWTWPTGLVVMFAILSVLLASLAWWDVRLSARKVQKSAVDELDRCVESLQNCAAENFEVPASNGGSARISRADYVKRLESLRDTAKNESRGAYAPWFQDPSYAAVYIPASITTILATIAQFCLNK